MGLITHTVCTPDDVIQSLLLFIVVSVTGRHQSWETRGVDEVDRDRTSFRAGLELVGNIGLWTTNVSSMCRLLLLLLLFVVIVVVVVVVADVSDGCTLMSTLHCTFP